MPTSPDDSSTPLSEAFTTFGDLLKYLRRRARLTQSELAIAVGYSREQITKLENNRRLPDLTALTALFVPALDLDERPDLVKRFLQLAAAARTTKENQRAASSSGSASPRTSRTNLPPPLTSFIGRERELIEIQRLLDTTRLLTLTGSAGVGKTRLALQLGAAMQEIFVDGVWLVELAPLSDPTSVPQAVASALGITVVQERPISSILADYLCDKHLLLILDNCEHLLRASAKLAEFVLNTAAQVRILATSREALGILSATTWQVPPLSLPAPFPVPATPSAVAYLRESEAVQLFIERATTTKPGFVLTLRNSSAIAQICHRLDGIPLAIELAATRVQAMSVQEIAARLDDRFKLLTSGNRTALPRHQTLRALIDWSYDLLSEQERVLLRRLSVFAGGCTSEAVKWMLEHEAAFDLLTHLANKSLVMVDEREGVTRYRLLETISDYAREKLVQATEERYARTRHLDYYIRLVEHAVPHLSGLYHMAWYARLEAEHDNLRTALAWATRHATPAALRLIANVWYFWLWNGYWGEGMTWADCVLPATAEERTRERVWALIGSALLAGRAGDNVKLNTWLAEGAALAEALGEQAAMAWARITMGIFTVEYTQATAFLEESIGLARAAQNDWLAAMSLFVLGERTRSYGDLERATILYTESLALFRAVGDRLMLAWPLGNLGRLALQRGHYDQAQAAFEESVTLCRAVGNKLGTADWLVQVATAALYRLDYVRVRSVIGECLALCHDIGHDGAIANCLVIAAGMAEAHEHWERDTTLLAAAGTILERFSFMYRVVDPSSYDEYKQRLELVRTKLSDQAFSIAWAKGYAMTRTQAIAYALTNDMVQC